MKYSSRSGRHAFAAMAAESDAASRVRSGVRRFPIGILLAIVCAICLSWALAPPSWAGEEASSIYDKSGVEHNEQCVKTTENKRVAVRGVNGNQLQAVSGAVTDPPEATETCKSGAGIRFQGIEAVKAKGMTMYYTWPFEKGAQSPGFVWVYELASAPSVNIAYAHGNGASAPLGSEPYYKITPDKIETEQGYQGGGSWYTYSPYGLPVGGAKFALMTWSWIDVGGGGIARAAVEEGETFYAADVRPITTESYSQSGTADGTVTARYGMVNSGEKLVWGWMVASHTYNGLCYNHMAYSGGGTALPETLCPGVSAGGHSDVTPDQATLEGTVYPNGTDTHYYFQYGTAPCSPTSCGSTQPTPPGTDVGPTGSIGASTTVQLAPGTTYHYRLVGTSSVGTSYGNEESFTTPGPVEAVTSAASEVTEEQAVLNGAVNPRGYDAKYYFQYGTTASYGLKTEPEGDAGAGSNPVPATAPITKLAPGTIYHYRLVSVSGGVTSYGVDEIFRTHVAPSMVVSNGTPVAATEGVNNGLTTTTADFAQQTWQSALLTASSSMYSAPSAAAESSGNVWIAFEAPGNSLRVGLDRVSGGWSPSYEGPAGTTYSAPSVAIDSAGNVWVVAEGPNHTLKAAEWVKSKGAWETSTLVTGEDVYSAPSAAGDSGGDVWVAFQGPSNSLWDGVRTTTGAWSTSYEGPTGKTYSAPSEAIDSSNNVWVFAQGATNTLAQVEMVKSKGSWETVTVISAADVYSAPSAAVDSGGDVWVAFQGPSNSLWDGVRTTSGAWSTSYEGPTGKTYSAPSESIDSANDVWVGAEGASNSLDVTVYLKTSGIWEASYEGTSEPSPTVSSPSIVVASGNPSAFTQTLSSGLSRTTADFSQNMWPSTVLGASLDTAYSAPSAAAESAGNVWGAAEGPSNSLWVGLDRVSGGWGPSYEGPNGTTYSAPSVVIDPNGDVFVVTEGPHHTLDLAEWVKSKGAWETSTLVTGEDVYSTPSAAVDASGNVWIAFEGPSNQLWIGLRRASGEWGMSYEGSNSTTYSAPSTVVGSSNVWVAAEGPNHTLNLAVWSSQGWETSTPISASDVDSAPSAALDSGGDVWVAFEGPSNSLWDGVRTTSGAWSTSYEGPTGTTYSAPSEAIDSANNIWVGAQGPGNSLNVTVYLKASSIWEVSYEGG